jgi:hypothetical protein
MAYRLLSRGSSSFARHALYSEQDHLLCITGSYTETYRRFFYRDLQAVMIRKTVAGFYMNVALGLLVVTFIALGLRSFEWMFTSVYWILGLIFTIPLIINLWLGPTCECRFQTAVQFERVEALNRLKKARKVIQQIMPMIESAQGPFDAQEMLQRALDLNFSVNTPDSTSPSDSSSQTLEAEA